MTDTTNHQRRRLAASLGLAASLLTSVAIAAESPGAHRHGHGQLQVAVDGNRLELIFTSPAYNLAGFERDAKTPEEEARLEDIRDWLGAQPLIDTDPGSCTVAKALVHYSGAAHSEHGHGHDDHEADSHREYEVSQQLECRKLGADQSFTAPVMGKFPDIEVLSVQWVSEAGQGSVRLEGSASRFTLDK